mgnify:CR=1 FL=1|jgi:hypothetical protein
MAAGKISNVQIDRAGRTKYVSAQSLAVLPTVTVDQGPPVAVTVAMGGIGTGALPLVPVGSWGLAGIKMVQGDALLAIRFPDLDDVDWGCPVGFAVEWASTNAAPTGSVVFTLGYSLGFIKSPAQTKLAWNPNYALTMFPAFAATTPVGQYKPVETAQVWLPKSLTQNFNANVAVESLFGVAATTVTAPVADVVLLGVKMFYTPLISPLSSASGGSVPAPGFK